MSFYVDADEQRARARRTEQVFLEHNRIRTPRPPQWQSEEEQVSSLPPVFRVDGHYQGGRETSIERRESRFRDQHIYGPPPPPPVPADAVPRLLPPKRFLVPQHLADRGLTNDPRYAVNDPNAYALARDVANGSLPPQPSMQTYPQPAPALSPGASFDPFARVEQWLPPDPEPAQPRYRRTPEGFAPILTEPLQAAPLFPPLAIPHEVQQQMRTQAPQSGGLTPSQKKRLRRKRAKEGRVNRPAPYPLEVDRPADPGLPQVSAPTQSQNGHAPHAPLPPPEPDPGITQTQCDAIVRVVLPNGSQIGLRCPLKPFPHPNQPHLVELSPAPGYEGTAVFIGWWADGE